MTRFGYINALVEGKIQSLWEFVLIACDAMTSYED